MLSYDDKLVTATDQSVKLGTDYPCTRPVNTRVQNDTRVHGPCWSSLWPTRPVNTGVIFVHGPWTRASFWTPVFTGRGYGPWTQPVDTS